MEAESRLRFSLTKADRILKRSEFVKLAGVGRRIQNESFILVYAPGCRDRCRIGVTATRRIGRAAKRNQVKRLMREFFRRNRHTLSGKWDMNIIAKRKAVTLSAQEAFFCLGCLFRRVSASNDD